ncbi:MAG: c-type cytochrome, partial [Gaiellaceae bacterium]
AAAAAARGAAPPGGQPTSKLVLRGWHLYGQNCLACHGMDARGNTHGPPDRIGAGPRRAQIQQQGLAPSLWGVGAAAADFYLRTGYMPLPRNGIQPRRARVTFSEPQLRGLIAFVASLGHGPAVPTPHPESGSISQGMKLFTDNCAGCHQIAAQGGYVTGATPPALEDDTSTQIAEAVRIGPYVMPSFSKKKISDHQLDSLITYVNYTKHADNRGGWSLGTIGPVPEGLVTWFIAIAFIVAVCMAVGRRLKHGAAE